MSHCWRPLASTWFSLRFSCWSSEFPGTCPETRPRQGPGSRPSLLAPLVTSAAKMQDTRPATRPQQGPGKPAHCVLRIRTRDTSETGCTMNPQSECRPTSTMQAGPLLPLQNLSTRYQASKPTGRGSLVSTGNRLNRGYSALQGVQQIP